MTPLEDGEGRPVVLICGSLYPTYGGARVVVDLAAAGRNDVLVVTHDGDALKNRYALHSSVAHRHIHRGSGALGWLFFTLRLARFFQKQPAGTRFVSFMTYTNLAAIVAGVMTRRTGDVVVSEHSVQSRALLGLKRGGLALRVIPALYPMAKAVICVSKPVAQDLVYLGVPVNQCEVVHNPVDLSRLSKLADVRAEWIASRHQYPNSAVGGPVFVCVSALRRVKRQHLLLEALAKHGNSSRLLLIGDGECMEELRQLSRKLGLQDRVEFAGHLDEPWAKAVSVGAVASLTVSEFEGFGLSVVESAAVGILPISTTASGLGEVLGMVGGLSLNPDDEIVEQCVDRMSEAAAKYLNWRPGSLDSFDPRQAFHRYREICER